ncbi:MAG: hypothetical protein A2Y94_02200 [Caldithrix sp. RBG_13_44_9]|nr:MAG: hypothetical protein A2Y94_02200 [Caldithrix sp. RBG_13_44_9]
MFHIFFFSPHYLYLSESRKFSAVRFRLSHFPISGQYRMEVIEFLGFFSFSRFEYRVLNHKNQ